MYMQPPPHPRAGAAVALAIVAAWLGALGVALAIDDTSGGTVDRGAAPATGPAYPNR
jgi:hypothetical protein